MTCERSVVFTGYSGFLQPIKLTDRYDMTEILLTLNTINQPTEHAG